MPQRRRRRERTLEEFLSWLLGPSSQRAADSAGDARALRKRIAWCWRPPAHRPAGRQAPHGHGGRHVHGPRLVPDHRHRRANRRGAGPAVARARVQGRIPGPVLPASRAGRAHHRRAARRGGGVHAGVAGNEDPALPGARAAQHEDGPDVQAQAPGRPRAEEAVRQARLGRDGRAGRQVGRGPQRMARTVEGLHRRTHLRARRPVQPQGVEAPVAVDARGAAALLPAAGEAVPRGQAASARASPRRTPGATRSWRTARTWATAGA